MTLSEVKSILKSLNKQSDLCIQLSTGESIPPHFHITEVGLLTKNFIDCGAKIRTEKKVTLQLWHADDTDHRLSPADLLSIIVDSQEALYLPDESVEVEYQTSSISKFGLEFDSKLNAFVLIATQTNCLALEKCGFPQASLTDPTREANEEVESTWKGIQKSTATGPCCRPGDGCC